LLIHRARQPVVVIEAIKLLEGNLPKLCDSIWVTYAPPDLQLQRLTATRSMSREEALVRIKTQGSQSDKIASADVVIRNLGSYDDLWSQVATAWREHIPVGARPDPDAEGEAAAGEVSVSYGRPEDSAMLAGALNRLSPSSRKLTADAVMAQVGQTTYILLHLNGEVVGLARWRVENFVACTADLHLQPAIDIEKAITQLIREIDRASADLQCEVSLLFLTTELAAKESLWTSLGYTGGTPEALAVQAWRDVANEYKPKETVLFFKRLLTDPVLGPGEPDQPNSENERPRLMRR
jgi:dephospho-CoA kinase